MSENWHRNPEILWWDLKVGFCLGVVVMAVRLVGWLVGAWPTIIP